MMIRGGEQLAVNEIIPLAITNNSLTIILTMRAIISIHLPVIDHHATRAHGRVRSPSTTLNMMHEQIKKPLKMVRQKINEKENEVCK